MRGQHVDPDRDPQQPVGHHTSNTTTEEAREDTRPEGSMESVEGTRSSNLFSGAIVKTEPMIEDMVLQQTVMQMKHQQLLQQQLMELNKQMLASQQEHQIGAFIHQMEQRRHREEAAPAPATAAAPPVAAPSLGKDSRENKFRLDILKQKDKTTESAVASPEVKRRLQEVILQRKRRETA